jgi:hypothetical protein
MNMPEEGRSAIKPVLQHQPLVRTPFAFCLRSPQSILAGLLRHRLSHHPMIVGQLSVFLGLFLRQID